MNKRASKNLSAYESIKNVLSVKHGFAFEVDPNREIREGYFIFGQKHGTHRYMSKTVLKYETFCTCCTDSDNLKKIFNLTYCAK